MNVSVLRRRHRLNNKGVELWLIEVYEPGGSTPVLAIANNPEDVEYDDQTYTGYNLSVELPKADLEGSLPSASVRITNVTRGLQQAMADAGYYRGGTLKIIAFNWNEAAADYTECTREMMIVGHETTMQDIVLLLSIPQELLSIVPEDLFGATHCRHRFRYTRCGYAGKTIQNVTLSGASPVSVQCTGHGLTTGVIALLETVGGITPSLNGLYTVTRTDDNNFALNGTDSSDYSGSYTSGGKAGYAYCEGTRMACRARGRIAGFGATPGLRSDTIQLGA
jgi:phage-related protein